MILRVEKGTPLTMSEMDNNLLELESRVTLSTEQTIDGIKTFNNIECSDTLLHDYSDKFINTRSIHNEISDVLVNSLNANISQTIDGNFNLSEMLVPNIDINDKSNTIINTTTASGISALSAKIKISIESPVNPDVNPIERVWFKISPTIPRSILDIYYWDGSWKIFAGRVVASCNYGTYVLDLDGKLWVMGYDTQGQFSSGDHSNFVDMGYVRKIVTSDSFAYIEKTDGTVWSTGYNGYGQLGLGDYDDRSNFTQLPIEFNNPRKIVLGSVAAFIEKSDGTVWAAGDNTSGKLGLGDNNSRNIFTLVPNITSPRKIAVGSKTTLIEDSIGYVYLSGLKCDLTGATYTNFNKIDGITNPNKLSLGNQNYWIEKSDGTVWVTGAQFYGELGLGDTNSRSTLTQLPVEFNNPKNLVAGVYSTTFIEKSDGTVWSCGKNDKGQLGLGDTTNRTTFTQINGIINPICIDNTSGIATWIVKSDNTVVYSGYVGYPAQVNTFTQININ
jgi:alpha-tubulin suppressor-like RCC1 family protein